MAGLAAHQREVEGTSSHIQSRDGYPSADTPGAGLSQPLPHSPNSTLQLAPGARVVIRDEEWLVRRSDPSADGGQLLTCDGISELVRGQSALFLTKLEDEIEVLDPARTELVPDASPTYNATMLYLESMRRRSVLLANSGQKNG